MAAKFPCLIIEGGLIGLDLIDQIAEGKAPGQKPADFGLDSKYHLVDEIASVWSDARAYWEAFLHRLERISSDDPATSVTRDQWMIPFFGLLGYELVYTPRAEIVEGQTYAISHRAGSNGNAPPIHIVGCRQSLDKRPESGRPRLAPHSLLQEYLNRTEHLWGIVTNGFTLRLLRDSQLIRRQAYIEFDLKQMMEGEKFSDFSLLYRLIHRSRLPRSIEDASDCLLEQYYRLTLEQGGRVRDRLRDGVEEALKIFANGFLSHPRNEDLRIKVQKGEVSALKFYRQLLRLIYRFLFLMVAEERNLITENQVYRDYYSISRLRRLVEERSAYTDYEDLWLGVKTTFRLFQDENIGNVLEIPLLNGDLFDPSQTEDLEELFLTNSDFLKALWHLSMYREDNRSPWRRINYSALDVEELGSVYESLLDFQPVFRDLDGRPSFELSYGTERKSTGSYYTPPELVNELIKSALIPVLEEKLKSAKSPEEKEQAILKLKVCDPACGSGHFLLAAARTLGKELAKIRTGDDEPSPEQTRLAIRDVITHCIYGVDKNPLAVDLCKVALWIEGHTKGKPLTFLDHRIRCGDSLIGVLDLNVLQEGIPDEAFNPVFGDDRATANILKRQNRSERRGQGSLPFNSNQEISSLLAAYRDLVDLTDDNPEMIRRKAQAYKKIQSEGTRWWKDNTACNLWTASFFVELTGKNNQDRHIPTTDSLYRYLRAGSIDVRLIDTAWELAQKYRFFHWPLEFPEVFAQGGFDVVLGNPPWERIKLQEQEFFALRDPEIASAPNKAARERLIKQLERKDPELWHEFQDAKHAAEAESKFLRASERFPLTARGDINTYAVFAELAYRLLNTKGRAGIIVPTGIATDDTCKHFFGDLIEKQRLVSLYDFENREKLFPAVDSRMKFCLLTIQGSSNQDVSSMDFVFFATRAEHINDKQRRFTLSREDFQLINPNTRTCPIFRTRADAELTRAIYKRVPVLVNERTGENPWGVRFLAMFHMSNDSHLFRTREQLEAEGFRLVGNRFVNDKEVWLPLYEGKMFMPYDHRFAHVVVTQNIKRPGQPDLLTEEEHQNPEFLPQPRFWVNAQEVLVKLDKNQYNWLLGFKNVTSPTNERTFLATILPLSGVGNSIPLILLTNQVRCQLSIALLANLNSITLDFVVRQKIGNVNLNFFIINQLPILSPNAYMSVDINFILPRVLELVYTSWDIKPFADDVWQDADETLKGIIHRQWQDNRDKTGGHEWQPPVWVEINESGIPLPPFKWDEERRAILRAELDAYYACLYGLTEEELRYILDPQDVCGPNFPGETFRVLKETEIHKYGEYRTKRLVLGAWEYINKSLSLEKK